MKILNKKDKKRILELLIANQIIFDNFDSLDGLDKFEGYSKFTENTAAAIGIIGGTEAIIAARDYIYKEEHND